MGNSGEIIIYQDKNTKARLEVKVGRETVWLTQDQIASLFGTQRPAITKHLKNIFTSKELRENSVSSILEHTGKDKKRYKVKFYNLDAIIAVGYRVNSKSATYFRIWATQVLKDHILKGFTVNQRRLKEADNLKLKDLKKAVRLLQTTLQSTQLTKSESEGLLSVILDYTNTWLLLRGYDDHNLKLQKSRQKVKSIVYGEALEAIEMLRKDLAKKNESVELFGREREKGLHRVVDAIHQTFDGKYLHPSLEEKAAHLLYFVIKDHPFVDGNKRIGAFLFVMFLQKNRFLYKKNGEKKINDNALVALALLIAQSDPKEKEIMVVLITNLLFEK